MSSQHRNIFIDCYDNRHYEDEINVVSGDTKYNFCFSSASKVNRHFFAGLFFDEIACSTRACFRYPASRRVCFLKESPVLGLHRFASLLEHRYRTILTFDSELLLRGSAWQRVDYGTNWIDWDGNEVTSPPAKERLLSFIANIQHNEAEGYNLRRSVAECLLADKRVDCFGKGIRWVDSKREGLIPYCFSVAMENTRKDFYYTEKLIDCFLTWTIPIYWGCDGISKIFDIRGMIQFPSLDDLPNIIGSLTFEKYKEMFLYAEGNRRKAIELRVHTQRGLYMRVAEQIAGLVQSGPPVSSLSTSRYAAGIRYVFSAR